ncbi:AI-2E family transporter [Kutzneria viridogrisea]|uniref:PurR-regulated permease PerM n=1 Tax=Kutzneria viridogrisea TaxID=47990 RepID=A0ABR6BDD5_9PSEU|nr:putative PurR-regulated permease PerM [Kutzneria viridogrisea]
MKASAPADDPTIPRGLVILLGTAAAVVTVAGMKAAAWLIAPTLLALVIVIVLNPVHRRLRRRGVPSWAATLALVVLVYGVLVTFGAVLVVSLARLAALLPRYEDLARALLADAVDLAGRWGVGHDQLRQVVNSLDPGRLMSALSALLGDLAGVTTSLVFLLALLLFLSLEASGVDVRLAEIAKDRPQIQDALGDFARRTRRYLVVTTVFGLVVAILDTLALAWLGIPLAVLWGLLSFVTNYIPNIGFLLGVVPPALLGLLGAGWRCALAVLGVYAVLNFVVQSLVQPRFVGDAVGLSTALTFLAVVFWAWVLGPLGALLAVPATLLVMTVLVDIDPRAGWALALLRAPQRRKGHRRRTASRLIPPAS